MAAAAPRPAGGALRAAARSPRRAARLQGSVRDRVLYTIVIFAVLLMAASYLIGQLTAGQDVKIIKDLGLAAMSLFGLFIAVFIGIGLVVEGGRAAQHLRAAGQAGEPRTQFILGKYLGLVADAARQSRA